MRGTGSALRLLVAVSGVGLIVSVTAPAWPAVGLAGRIYADVGARDYVVQPGDTLWGIADDELGDPYRWPEIAAASASIIQPGGARLTDPDLIRPGWTLLLPGQPDEPGPVTVSGVSGATAVAAGERSTCALVAGGQVSCWGEWGASSRSAWLVPEVSGATGLTEGWYHACALVPEGRVSCWGDNSSGQLGLGGEGPEGWSTAPVVVPEASGATALGAGGDYTCAVAAGGKVTCWGVNFFELEQAGSTSAAPALVPAVKSATAVDTTGLRTCAVVAGGQVTCWGGNDQGQLGYGFEDQG